MDWESALSRPGWANCSLGRYLSGVWREYHAVISLPDGIDNVKKGQCCSPPHEYKDDTPVCQTLNWKTSLSRSVTMNKQTLLRFYTSYKEPKEIAGPSISFLFF